MTDKKMNKIAAGVVKFQKEAFPAKKALYSKLAERQDPDALFITCSDSRVDPNFITQSEPGELFICRNAGNIVPPHTNHTGAMTASIEFAVGALNVSHIIICGHAGCGAMMGALNPDLLADLPHSREWLSYARAATLIVKERGGNLSEEERLNAIIRENVILQVAHLKTHPFVAARLAAGKTEIYAWVYDIKSGGVEAYDDGARAFIPVADHYKDVAG